MKLKPTKERYKDRVVYTDGDISYIKLDNSFVVYHKAVDIIKLRQRRSDRLKETVLISSNKS